MTANKRTPAGPRLRLCVIGNGPLGLFLCNALSNQGHEVMNVYSSQIKGAWYSNMGTMISPLRYVTTPGSKAIMNAFAWFGRHFYRETLQVPMSHYGAPEFNHGVFLLEGREQLEQIRNQAKQYPSLQLNISELRPDNVKALLGPRFQSRYNVACTSDEIPFSQNQISTFFSEGNQKLLVQHQDSGNLKIELAGEGVRIYFEGGNILGHFDYLFVAAGKSMPNFLKQLSIPYQKILRIKQVPIFRLPDDSGFLGSVVYDFKSQFSLVRHKYSTQKGNAKCLLALDGKSVKTIRNIEDIQAEDLVGSEKEEALEGLRRNYEFNCKPEKIRARYCYMIEKAPERAGALVEPPTIEPFIYQPPDAARVIFGSCFRTTLAPFTAKEMIKISGLPDEVSFSTYRAPSNQTSGSNFTAFFEEE